MFNHIPVLLNECIDSLSIKEDGIYVDATLGGASHASEILKRLKSGLLIGFDKDIEAIKVSQERLSKIGSNFKIIHSDFKNLKEELAKIGIYHIDGILLDLGVSSHQFDTPERGFSYKFDARLDMRMDQGAKLDAYYIINTYSQEKLTEIFYKYGEEKFARNISAKIVAKRKIKPIETTFELVEVIKSALPSYVLNGKGHPAKQVFQALRIEVNDELGALESVLDQALSLLNSNGRMAIITFHSLEDRIVKLKFNDVSTNQNNVKGLASLNENEPSFRLVNRHVIVSSQKELDMNNRAHSAKLRVIEKI